jgi:hypothetical protein
MSTATQPTSKPHISATQLEMFWRCPEQYRRRYIEGERLPPGVALLVGSGMHIGAQVNFAQKIETHKDLLSAHIVQAAIHGFENRVAGDGFLLSEEEASRGAKVVLGEAKDLTAKLAGAHAEHQAPDYQPVAVEHTTRIVFPNASHDLLGVTDLRDDQDRVTDFKTAKSKPPADDAERSTQLTIYAAAFQIENARPPSEVRLDVITKTKTPGRHVLVSHRDRSDFAVLANRVNVTLAAIKAGVFPPASPGNWACSAKWCGFALTCPYFNSERRAAAKPKGG